MDGTEDKHCRQPHECRSANPSDRARGVTALSGFVLPKAGVAWPGSRLGQPIVFALIIDGVSSDKAGRAIADQVGVALAAYPVLPRLAEIEPSR